MSIIIEIFIFLLSVYFMIIWISGLIYKKKYIINLDSTDVFYYKSYFLTLFYISLFILILMFLKTILSYLGYLFFKNKTKEIDNSKIIKSLKVINLYLTKLNLPFKLYSLIFEYYGNGGKYSLFIQNLGKKVINLGKKKVLIIISLFVFLPRFLIIMFFLLEISRGQLHYYFYSLYLLIIPTLFRLILFIFCDITIRVLPELEKMIIHETNTEPLVMPDGKKCLVLSFKLLPEFDDVDKDNFFFNFYYPMLFLSNHMSGIIMPIYHKILQISLFFYYFLHALGLGYLLFLI